MRIVFGFVLLLGLALAGLAVYMAQGYIGAQQAQIERQSAAAAEAVPVTEIYVAAAPLAYGAEVSPEAVRLARWPVDALPKGAFARTEEGDALFPEGESERRVALRAMEAGEPILAVKVTAPGEDAGPAARLGRGMRAFAISVDVASGVSGFLRPGDRVDVYWSGERLGQEVTRVVETQVSIVAIDQTADTDQTSAIVARTVTVEVTPMQVAALAQAQATGRLSLALVGTGDETETASVQLDQRTFLQIEDAPAEAAAAPAPRACTVRTRRGGEAVEIPVPCMN